MSDYNVLLNSVRYQITGPVQRFLVEPMADSIRIGGRQRLEGLTSRQSYVFTAPTFGMGLRRIPTDRVDDPLAARRTWDSMADSRFGAGATLPLLMQGSTEPTLSGDILYSCRFFIPFKSDIWGFWDGEDVGIFRGAGYAASYGGSGTTWGTANLIANSGTVDLWFIPLWATVVSNYLIVLNVRADDHLFYRSTDGATWNAASTQPTANMLANDVTQAERIFAGVCTTVGATAWAFLWDEDNDEIEAWTSTNQGDTWTAVSGAIVAPGGGPRGVAIYIDLNGDPAPVFSTQDGLYALDTSASVVQKLLSWDIDSNSGRGLTRWSNPVTGLDGLYCGLGDGNMVEYIHLGGSGASAKTFAQTVGLPESDGVVTDKEGYITWMAPSARWLYYAVGGDASGRNAWVGAYDGKGSRPEWKGAGHHFMAQDATANRQWWPLALSAADDDTPRLHHQVYAVVAEASPAFDATSQGTNSASSSITVSHTCTGSNRIVIFWCGGNVLPISATYAGVAMTQLGTNQASGGFGIGAWYLIDPATGANDFVVALSQSGTAVLVAMSFTGVDQTSPFSAVVESTAAAQTSRTAAPVSRTGTITIGGIGHQVNEAHTPNTGDTERQDVGTTNARISCNHEAHSSGVTTTVGASWTTSEDASIIAATLVGAISNQGNTRFQGNPNAAPDSSITRRFEDPTAAAGGADTGYIVRPETNMGMPRDDAAFIAIFVEARNLSATNSGEFINENYGVDGATPTTDIGDMLDGTREIAIASGAGVSGRSFQLREELDRDSGDNTQTPLLIATEVMYSKAIPSLRGWQFRVDVKETAGQEESVSIADVVNNLLTAESNVLLQAFQDQPGGATTFYVKVRVTGWLDEHGRAVSPYEPTDEPQVRTVDVRLQEVL